MADVVSIGQQVASVDVSPQFLPYSKVVIHVDDDTAFVEGNDTGRVFEIDNPFGSQEMARNILSKLSGYRYQPFAASEAILDPAAEIGDVVNTATSYGGLYTRNRTFGRLMRADVSAPNDEDIDHEFRFVPPQERKFTRVTGELRASLILTNSLIEAEVVNREAQGTELSSRITLTASQLTAEIINRQNADNEMSSRITQNADGITAEVNRATQEEGRLQSSLSVQASAIAAKVSSSGGGSSFSWVLDSASHTWKSNNTDVMRVSASGLWLKGQIEATTGKIGGFDIGSNALSYNGLTWGDVSKNYGAYIGQSGIQLGKNFSVDNAGNLSATNIRLQGSLSFYNSDGTYAGGMSAANFLRGASEAYNNYGSWNGAADTVESNSGYWSGGAGYGFSFGNAINSSSGIYPSFFRATVIYASGTLQCGSLQVGSYFASWHSRYVKDSNGDTILIRYLGRD